MSTNVSASVTFFQEDHISNISTNELDDLPISFDLRHVDGAPYSYVSPVKNQNGGTCWCHGTMASIESNLLMTGNWFKAGETSYPDLAEYHLDWWNGFNSYNNDDDPGGIGVSVHYGGDYRMASAYLARGEGAVRERDAYHYSSPPKRSKDSYHYYYPSDICWLTAGEDLTNINTIKREIMDHGAIGTSMCYSNDYIEVIDNRCVHFDPNSDNPNHAIAIIGWDDTINTQAQEDGAWLCKNSWSIDWCDNGYFWISYYDKHCCQHPEMGAISFQNVKPLPYSHIYYHDYHGWRDTLTKYNKAFNAFTATDDEILNAVSFYTAANNVNYKVSVYDNFENEELANELSSKQGFINYSGFHTVDLNQPVNLNKNDDFYIFVEFSNGGHPYDRTSEVEVLLGAFNAGTEVKSSANPGESYFCKDGNWIDLYLLDDSANFCIKGLVSKRSDLTCNDESINWVDLKPNSEVSHNISIENVGESFSTLDWKIVEQPEWGTWDFDPIEGFGVYPESGSVMIKASVLVPDEKNKNMDGQIKIVNQNDPNDYEIIPVTLSTIKNNECNNPLFIYLQTYESRFPIIQKILQILESGIMLN